MKRRGIVALLLCIFIGFVIVTGCTSNEPAEVPPVPVTEITQTPEIPETDTPVPEPAEPSVFDQPVSQPPDELSVAVSADKDPVYGTITVTFDGGLGQDLIQSMEVRADLSDGQIIEMPLGTGKGDEVDINGTRGTDRVQVAVTFMNGDSYKILDTELSLTRADEITQTAEPTETMIAADDGEFAGPVEKPPRNLDVSVEVDKDPIYRVITATFRGGHGQSLVSSIDVHGVLSDGSTVTNPLTSNMGATTEIQGTNGIDKIQVKVRYKNGESYKIFEDTFGPRG